MIYNNLCQQAFIIIIIRSKYTSTQNDPRAGSLLFIFIFFFFANELFSILGSSMKQQVLVANEYLCKQEIKKLALWSSFLVIHCKNWVMKCVYFFWLNVYIISNKMCILFRAIKYFVLVSPVSVWGTYYTITQQIPQISQSIWCKLILSPAPHSEPPGNKIPQNNLDTFRNIF